MLKRNLFAILLAGVCAFSFVACDDDNDKKDDNPCASKNVGDSCGDNKVCNDKKECVVKSDDNPCKDKNVGDACGDNKVCDANKACVNKEVDLCKDKNEGDACGDNKVCDASKKCVDDSGDKKCSKSDDCEGNKDGKYVCDTEAEKCVECLAKNVVDDSCDNSKPGPVCISNVCSKCTDSAQCGDGKICDTESGKCLTDASCILDDDCKDPTKPYCSKDHVCVATKETIDNCGDCAAGKCYIDICVTDEMTVEGAECNTYANDAFFCVGDVFWYCDKGVRKSENCATSGYGSCSRFRDNAGITAQCTGSAEMREHCTGETALLCDPEGIDKYKCITDIRGDKMAIYAGDNSTAQACANGCEYGSEGPVCK